MSMYRLCISPGCVGYVGLCFIGSIVNVDVCWCGRCMWGS